MTTGEIGSAYKSTVTGIQYSVKATVPFSDLGSPLPYAKDFEHDLIELFAKYVSSFEEDELNARTADTKS